MKILIIQERGRHEKNREFREALCLQRALKRAGQQSTVWGLGYENFVIPFNEIANDYNVVISLENYDTGWHPNISAFNGLKCFWSIDSHCVVNDHIRFCELNKIDLILNSSAQYLHRFSECTKHGVWFPNGYPSDLIHPLANVKREHDVGFVGSSITSRDAILDELSTRIPIKRETFVIGNDMVRALSSYKIAFNYNIADDINFRSFEAPGAGALLLTNYTPGLEKLYDIDNEVIIYESFQDILEKIQDLLSDDFHLEKIAKAGYNRAIRDHSYDSRASQLLDLIKQYKQPLN